MIIALSGYATCGKDTVADMLVEDHGFVKYAWADTLRQAAVALDPIVGWDVTKDEPIRYTDALEMYGYDNAKALFTEFRRVLQFLGTEVGRKLIDDNVWVDATINRIERERSTTSDIVITDTRFSNEAHAVVERAGIVVRVTRPGVGPANEHPSETGLDGYNFDYHIYNDGGLDKLRESVYTLCTAIEKVR